MLGAPAWSGRQRGSAVGAGRGGGGLRGAAPASAGHAESLHVITTPSVNASPALCVAPQSVSALFARVTVISNCALPDRRVRVTCGKVVQKRNSPALKHTRVCVRGVTWRLDPRVQLLRRQEEEEKPWPHPPGRSVRTARCPHTRTRLPAGCEESGARALPRRAPASPRRISARGRAQSARPLSAGECSSRRGSADRGFRGGKSDAGVKTTGGRSFVAHRRSGGFGRGGSEPRGPAAPRRRAPGPGRPPRRLRSLEPRRWREARRHCPTPDVTAGEHQSAGGLESSGPVIYALRGATGRKSQKRYGGSGRGGKARGVPSAPRRRAPVFRRATPGAGQ